ncbi:MAG: N-acetylmuramoyl-L-alanine amidase [Betaproteobacteria bacterium]|jgi:spore germination cell wall hydrolase CwlJ-like protein|nr:N-acetylmuramoyl-L-alanine amidase [Betaproteobacteria bacterium]
MPMLWKLRLFWYEVDKAGLAFAAYFILIVGGLVFGLMAVFAQRDAQAARVRDFHASSVDCLARNVYYEARGESLAGQYAVAEVTMNRKASRSYPKTVCEVVYQKDAFSWTGMTTLDMPAGEAWGRAIRVAQDVYYGRRRPELRGALHYHATYVQPGWSDDRERIGRIGRHVFYR